MNIHKNVRLMPRGREQTVAPMVLDGAIPAAAAICCYGALERRGDSRYAFWVENFLSFDIRSTGGPPPEDARYC